jgi:hypothetical protein
VGFAGALLVPVTAEALGWPWAMATGAVAAVIGATLWLFIRADAPMRVPPAA